jgi:hypothetical protein
VGYFVYKRVIVENAAFGFNDLKIQGCNCRVFSNTIPERV